MYNRHNNWDEDKWDIHSTGSGSRSYTSNSSKEPQQDYHKNEVYNSNKPDEDKVNNDYQSMKKENEDKKKENEDKEKTIVDAVEQEEKYQKKEQEEEEDFNLIAKDIQNNDIETETNKDKNMKKKKNKSIEDAIKEAIKEEKEIVHVD